MGMVRRTRKTQSSVTPEQNILDYRAAWEEFSSSTPFAPEDMKRYRELVATMRTAAGKEHKPTTSGDGHFSDWIVCGCGWETAHYWDGLDYAWAEWRWHVADEFGLLPRRCKCGKQYLPVEGGKPCHKLVEV